MNEKFEDRAMSTVQTDWRQVADTLAEALRGCQVPSDWPMAWPDGMSEGAPWVDEALAVYKAALDLGQPKEF